MSFLVGGFACHLDETFRCHREIEILRFQLLRSAFLEFRRQRCDAHHTGHFGAVVDEILVEELQLRWNASRIEQRQFGVDVARLDRAVEHARETFRPAAGTRGNAQHNKRTQTCKNKIAHNTTPLLGIWSTRVAPRSQSDLAILSYRRKFAAKRITSMHAIKMRNGVRVPLS